MAGLGWVGLGCVLVSTLRVLFCISSSSEGWSGTFCCSLVCHFEEQVLCDEVFGRGMVGNHAEGGERGLEAFHTYPTTMAQLHRASTCVVGYTVRKDGQPWLVEVEHVVGRAISALGWPLGCEGRKHESPWGVRFSDSRKEELTHSRWHW